MHKLLIFFSLLLSISINTLASPIGLRQSPCRIARNYFSEHKEALLDAQKKYSEAMPEELRNLLKEIKSLILKGSSTRGSVYHQAINRRHEAKCKKLTAVLKEKWHEAQGLLETFDKAQEEELQSPSNTIDLPRRGWGWGRQRGWGNVGYGWGYGSAWGLSYYPWYQWGWDEPNKAQDENSNPPKDTTDESNPDKGLKPPESKE